MITDHNTLLEPQHNDLPQVSEDNKLEIRYLEPLHESDAHDGLDRLEDAADPADQLMQDLASVQKSKPAAKVRVEASKIKRKKKPKKVVPEPLLHDENEDADSGLVNGARSEGTATEATYSFEHVEEDEDVLDIPPPKTLFSREANGKFSKSSRKSIPAVVRPLEQEGLEEERAYVDPVALLNAARLRRNMIHTAKLKKSVMESEEDNPVLQELDNLKPNTVVSDGLASHAPDEFLPNKSIASKLIRENPSSVPAVAAGQDIPIWPTSRSRPVVEIPWSSARDPVSSQLAWNHIHLAPIVSDTEEDGTPKQPSKKALGKRKAVDRTSGDALRKRTKRIIDKGQPGKDLRTFFPLATSAEVGEPEAISGRLDIDEEDRGEMQDMEEEESLFISPARPPPTLAYANNPRTSAKPLNGRPSWNAINKPVERSEAVLEDALNHVPDPEDTQGTQETATLHQSVKPLYTERGKRQLPADEPGPSTIKPTKIARSIHKEVNPKTPQSTASKRNRSSPSVVSTGKMTNQDITAVSEAVGAFRMVKDMSDFQFKEMVQASARDTSGEAKEFWDWVCKEVPWISTRKVYNFCRRKYHNFEARGTWTAEQDEELRMAFESNPNKWTIIGREINRFPEDARDRWRNYVICGDNMKKDAWDQDEENQLSLAVEECILIVQAARRRSGGRRLGGDDEKYIDWNRVSEKMGHTRSRLQCSVKWKQLKQRQESDGEDEVAQTPISNSWRLDKAYDDARALSATEKLQLLHAIRDSGAAREGKIPWGIVRDQVDKNRARMTWKACFQGLKKKIPGQEEMKFEEILEVLIDAFEASAPYEPDGFTLARPPSERLRPPTVASRPWDNTTSQDGNGEGPSTASNTANKRKKFRERMRREDESTQDTAINGDDTSDHGSPIAEKQGRTGKESKGQNSHSFDTTAGQDSDDISTALQALRKSSQPRKSRVVRAAKMPISKAKRAQRKTLSEEIVVEDSSNDEANHSAAHEDNYEMEVDQANGLSGPHDSESNDVLEADERSGSVDSHHSESHEISEKDEANGLLDFQNSGSHGVPEEEEEDPDTTHHDTESIDLDGDATTTSNGHYTDEEGDEEAPSVNGYHSDEDLRSEEDTSASEQNSVKASHHDTENIELDVDRTIIPNGYHRFEYGEGEDEDEDVKPDVRGFHSDEDEHGPADGFEGSHHATESIGRSPDRPIIPSGYYVKSEGSDEEAEDLNPDENDYNAETGLENNRHDTESVDLDTAVTKSHEDGSDNPGPPLPFGGWSDSDDSDDSDSGSLSSDASSIPSTRPALSSRMERVDGLE